MSVMEKRILVIDDDSRLRDLLTRYLSEQGFTAQAAADANAMDSLLARERFDLMVLDLMLPEEDGLAICRRLRGQGVSLPIIMLTARGDEIDRILGLEMGADDYLPKPFNPRELLARIHAVLRRQAPAAPALPDAQNGHARFGPYHFEPDVRKLTREGELIPLTSGEFALLAAFTTHPGQPLTREKLMELTRGRDLDAFDRSVDVQISRLRKLIEPDPAHPRYIQTVWGFGYVFVPDQKKGSP